MTNLKSESVEKCFSLLREFIEGVKADNRGAAILALNHLKTVTAGTNTMDSPACAYIPRIDGSPTGY